MSENTAFTLEKFIAALQEIDKELAAGSSLPILSVFVQVEGRLYPMRAGDIERSSTMRFGKGDALALVIPIQGYGKTPSECHIETFEREGKLVIELSPATIEALKEIGR